MSTALKIIGAMLACGSVVTCGAAAGSNGSFSPLAFVLCLVGLLIFAVGRATSAQP